jgi:triosephosphate isomerase
LTDKWGNDVAQGIRILYGGSMKPENAAELLACEDIDGGFDWWCSPSIAQLCRYREGRSLMSGLAPWCA